MTVVDRFVQAVSHGGAMRPTLQVVHSAETPLRAGYAASIAENWFGRSAPTSAHFMVDPVELIRMLSDNVVAYAVGPAGNGFTLNWEQAGYAHLSRGDWITDAGLAQMDKLAAGIRERGLANGIPLRWATDDQIRAAAHGVPGGICYHDDIRRVLGGTVHTDPTPNYPRDLLMQRVLSSAPTPTPPPSQEDDDMLIVWIKVSDTVEIPHLITGDRYFALDSVSTARSMEKVGVKSVHLPEGAHPTFASALRSEAPPAT